MGLLQGVGGGQLRQRKDQPSLQPPSGVQSRQLLRHEQACPGTPLRLGWSPSRDVAVIDMSEEDVEGKGREAVRSGAWLYIRGLWRMSAEWAKDCDGIADMKLGEVTLLLAPQGYSRKALVMANDGRIHKISSQGFSLQACPAIRCIECHVVI